MTVTSTSSLLFTLSLVPDHPLKIGTYTPPWFFALSPIRCPLMIVALTAYSFFSRYTLSPIRCPLMAVVYTAPLLFHVIPVRCPCPLMAVAHTVSLFFHGIPRPVSRDASPDDRSILPPWFFTLSPVPCPLSLDGRCIRHLVHT